MTSDSVFDKCIQHKIILCFLSLEWPTKIVSITLTKMLPFDLFHNRTAICYYQESYYFIFANFSLKKYRHLSTHPEKKYFWKLKENEWLNFVKDLQSSLIWELLWFEPHRLNIVDIDFIKDAESDGKRYEKLTKGNYNL